MASGSQVWASELLPVRLESEVPDRSVLKKPPSGPFWQQARVEGKTHKLWLMHWLVEESSEMERAVVPGKRAGAQPLDATGTRGRRRKALSRG